MPFIVELIRSCDACGKPRQVADQILCNACLGKRALREADEIADDDLEAAGEFFDAYERADAPAYDSGL